MSTTSSAPLRSLRSSLSSPSSPLPQSRSSNGATGRPSPVARPIDGKDSLDVRVAGIVKQFGAAAALRGVSLDIRAGELMALLGPSGSGKTTLLRVIAGLEIPEAGQVFFGDEDATKLSVQRRGIGFVFQHYALFKHLTVSDNVAYGLQGSSPQHAPCRA